MADRTFLPQPPVRFEFSNGIGVHHGHKPELPLTVMTMLLAGGGDTDDADRSGATLGA